MEESAAGLRSWMVLVFMGLALSLPVFGPVVDGRLAERAPALQHLHLGQIASYPLLHGEFAHAGHAVDGVGGASVPSSQDASPPPAGMIDCISVYASAYAAIGGAVVFAGLRADLLGSRDHVRTFGPPEDDLFLKTLLAAMTRKPPRITLAA